MEDLRKLLLLRPSEWRLLWKSVLLLWAVRLGLWLLPLSVLRRLLAKLRPAKPIVPEKDSNLEKIIWALAVGSRYVPAATCLTQAMAGRILLAQHGEPGLLQIGVAKNDQGKLEAHAWVESRGRIVIGDSRELCRYTRLPSVGGEPL
jgi:Transglutaminase-like superfamily